VGLIKKFRRKKTPFYGEINGVQKHNIALSRKGHFTEQK
jgi:hypothetical protein